GVSVYTVLNSGELEKTRMINSVENTSTPVFAYLRTWGGWCYYKTTKPQSRAFRAPDRPGRPWRKPPANSRKLRATRRTIGQSFRPRCGPVVSMGRSSLWPRSTSSPGMRAFLNTILESSLEVLFCILPQIEGPAGKFLPTRIEGTPRRPLSTPQNRKKAHEAN